MEDRFELFYCPGSYFSQKALLILFEKGVPFKHRLVSLSRHEQMEPWFMQMNPAGEVPVLKDGDEVIADSENILEYIDKVIETGPRLLTTEENASAQRARSMHALLRQHIYISYEIYFNPDLVPGGIQRSGDLEEVKEEFSKVGDQLRALAEARPEWREAYLAKLGKWQQRMSNVLDPQAVQGKLQQLDNVFTQVERCLQETQTEDSGAEWLSGRDFRAPDVILAVLCLRMQLLGLASHFLSAQTRPRLHGYWGRVQTRPAFQQLLTCIGQ